MAPVLPILMDRLNTEGTRAEAVACFGALAAAPTPVHLKPVLQPLLAAMATFLRKVQRGLRHATLAAAVTVLRRHAADLSADDQGAVGQMLLDATPLVSEADLPLAAAVLRMGAAAFEAG
jgi:hypothetical protein